MSGKSLQDLIPDETVVVVSSTTAVRITKHGWEDYSCLNSNHDEADTRLLLHAADAIRTSDLLIIRIVDTDVLGIAIHHFYQMTKDWRNKGMVMHVGMGAHKRYISLTHLISNLPCGIVKNILLLHALTGCDTVSSIFRI